MRFAASVGLACLICVVVAAEVRADALVFDQALPATPVGFGWNSDGPSSNATSPFVSTVQISDEYSLSSATDITSITWWGSYHSSEVPAAAKDFRLRFYSGLVGTGDLITSQTVTALGVNTGLGNSFGFSIMEYTATLGPAVSLDAGGGYLGIDENDGSTTSVWTWSFNADPGGGSWYQPDYDVDWIATGAGDMAFTMTGNVVPEPGSIALLALGLVGVGRVRRRRANASP